MIDYINDKFGWNCEDCNAKFGVLGGEKYRSHVEKQHGYTELSHLPFWRLMIFGFIIVLVLVLSVGE